MPVRPLARLAVALATAALLAGCAGPGRGVAAVINGTQIDAALVERLVEAQLSAAQTDVSGLPADERAQTVGESQRQVLTSLIRIEVVAQVAAAEGIEITEEDLDERFAQEAEARGGEEALTTLLDESGLTLEDFRQLVLADLARQEALQERFSGDEVTEEELRAAYEQRASQGRYEQADVRHILVETEQEANQILQRLEEGGDFAELARARSQDGSAEQGGELGTQAISGYVEPFAQAVRDAEEGELVGPVETQFGFHVIQVQEFVSPSFDDVRADLEQELSSGSGETGLREAVGAAISDAQVEVASRFGSWDAQAGQIVPTDLVGDAPAGGGAPPAPGGGASPPAPTPSATE